MEWNTLVTQPADEGVTQETGSVLAVPPLPAAAPMPPWNFEPLIKLGALAAGLSALAVLVGFAFERAFYGSLGLAWYLPNISAATAIQTGSVYISLLAAFAYMATNTLVRGTSVKRVDFIAGVVAAVAALTLFVPQFFSSWLSPKVEYYLAFFGVIVFMSSAGATLGIVFFQTRGQQTQWRHSHTGHIVWVYLTLAAFCPQRLGMAQAAFQMDLGSSDLPKIISSGSGVRADTRLVHLEGDTALVAQLEAGKQPVFQVLKVGQGIVVASTRGVDFSTTNAGAAPPARPASLATVAPIRSASSPAPANAASR